MVVTLRNPCHTDSDLGLTHLLLGLIRPAPSPAFTSTGKCSYLDGGIPTKSYRLVPRPSSNGRAWSLGWTAVLTGGCLPWSGQVGPPECLLGWPPNPIPAYTCWCCCWAEMDQSGARSFSRGFFPCGFKGLGTLSCPCCFPRHISREPDRNVEHQEGVHIGCQCNPTCYTTAHAL